MEGIIGIGNRLLRLGHDPVGILHSTGNELLPLLFRLVENLLGPCLCKLHNLIFFNQLCGTLLGVLQHLIGLLASLGRILLGVGAQLIAAFDDCLGLADFLGNLRLEGIHQIQKLFLVHHTLILTKQGTTRVAHQSDKAVEQRINGCFLHATISLHLIWL